MSDVNTVVAGWQAMLADVQAIGGPPLPTAVLAVGARCKVIAVSAKMRTTANPAAAASGWQPTNSQGLVIGNLSNGFWKVDFDSGVDGWVWNKEIVAIGTTSSPGNAATVAAINAASAEAQAITAIPPPPPPPPTGEVVAVNSAQRFQTMRGWDVTGRGWEIDKVNLRFDQTWNQHNVLAMQKLVNEVGINRLQLCVKSGWKNPVDWWTQFENGQITLPQWGPHAYEKIAGAPTQFSEFDFNCDTKLVPMLAAMQARGEMLVVALIFIDFGTTLPSTFDFSLNPTAYAAYVKQFVDRLQTRHGVTVSEIDMCLEPENATGWGTNPERIGNALVALRNAVGPNVRLTAPSCTRAYNVINYCNAIATVPSAVAALDRVGYHLYGGSGDGNNRGAIWSWANSRGKETGMTEWYPATIDTLLDDLLIGNVSLWPRWAIALQASPTNSGYFTVDLSSTPPVFTQNAPELSLIFPYVRMNAQRIGCTATAVRAVAFENANGAQVVFAKRTGAAVPVTFTGLRPGVYGVRTLAGSGADITADATGRTTVALAPGCTTIFGR